MTKIKNSKLSIKKNKWRKKVLSKKGGRRCTRRCARENCCRPQQPHFRCTRSCRRKRCCFI